VLRQRGLLRAQAARERKVQRGLSEAAGLIQVGILEVEDTKDTQDTQNCWVLPKKRDHVGKKDVGS